MILKKKFNLINCYTFVKQKLNNNNNNSRHASTFTKFKSNSQITFPSAFHSTKEVTAEPSIQLIVLLKIQEQTDQNNFEKVTIEIRKQQQFINTLRKYYVTAYITMTDLQ